SDLQPHSAIARSSSSLSIPSTAETPRSPSTTRPHSTGRPTGTAARAERERLHDVRASSDAAADERLGATARRWRLSNSNRTPATAGFHAPLLRDSARFTSAMGRFVRVGARPTSGYD